MNPMYKQLDLQVSISKSGCWSWNVRLEWGVLKMCDPEKYYSIYWFCHSSMQITAQSQLCKKGEKHEKYLTTQYRQPNHNDWRQKRKSLEKFIAAKNGRCVCAFTHKSLTNKMLQNVFRNHNGTADVLVSILCELYRMGGAFYLI